jgi:succinate dehydrogenase / fumarate reductase iron-sulfur subunit
MLDVFNQDLMNKGGEPVAFDHDCRRNLRNVFLYINGEHGPDRKVTTCQLHMRMFKDGDTITLNHFVQSISSSKRFSCRSEPDSARWRIYICKYLGNTIDEHNSIHKQDADDAFDAATCIGWWCLC